MEGGEQKACLRIDQGKVELCEGSKPEHCIHAGHGLARLLIGSDEPHEVMRQEGISWTGMGDVLAEVLFRNLHPMMSHWDEF